jgi:hypothetical protein
LEFTDVFKWMITPLWILRTRKYRLSSFLYSYVFSSVDSICCYECAMVKWINSSQTSVLTVYLSMSKHKEVTTSRKQGRAFAIHSWICNFLYYLLHLDVRFQPTTSYFQGFLFLHPKFWMNFFFLDLCLTVHHQCR